VPQISLEPLNGLAPNSHGIRVWSLAQTSLNVKDKGKVTRDKNWKTAASSPLTVHVRRAPYAASDVMQPPADRTIASQLAGDGVTGMHAAGGLCAMYVW